MGIFLIELAGRRLSTCSISGWTGMVGDISTPSPRTATIPPPCLRHRLSRNLAKQIPNSKSTTGESTTSDPLQADTPGFPHQEPPCDLPAIPDLLDPWGLSPGWTHRECSPSPKISSPQTSGSHRYRSYRLLVGHHQPSHNCSFPLALSAPLRRQEGRGPTRLPERSYSSADRPRAHLRADVQGDPGILRVPARAGGSMD